MSREPLQIAFKLSEWGRKGLIAEKSATCNKQYHSKVESLYQRARVHAICTHQDSQNVLYGAEEPTKAQVKKSLFEANASRAFFDAASSLFDKKSSMFYGLEKSQYSNMAEAWISEAERLSEDIAYGTTVYAPASRNDPRDNLLFGEGGYQKRQWQMTPSTGNTRGWVQKHGSRNSKWTE